MLPQSDVSSAAGTPLKLTDSKVETNATGTATLQTQTCNYDPPGGIGSGPTTVRVIITAASSVPVAAQTYKFETQTIRPMVAGKGVPLSGVGDEAQSFHAPGTVYMRKKNIIADIHVGLRDLNLDKEVAVARDLALKIAAHIP